MADIIGGKWELKELVAVAWGPEMAEQFPDADHAGCRQEMQHDGTSWQPFKPPRCVGWHCPLCGSATNAWGHHNCPARGGSNV